MTSRSEALQESNVRRAQRGDERARSAVLAAVEPVLRGYFVKRIGKKSEVDDLVQNTLLRLHRDLEALEKPGSLKAFAMKAALFELQDFYRGRYSMKEQAMDPAAAAWKARRAPKPVSAEVDAERALALLSQKARRIMELRAYGYRYREIAQMLDTTEAAVKMQVKRAFDTMRKALAGLLLVGMIGLF